MYKITITIPVCLNYMSRIEHFDESTKSLAEALKNEQAKDFIDNITIVFGIEPVENKKAVEIIRKNLDGFKYKLLLNRKRLSVRGNPFNLMCHVFNEGSEFNIHLEDDVLYSKNILVVAKWMYENYKEDKLAYYAYGLFNYMNKKQMKKRDIYRVVEKNGFIGLGWAIFKENWYEHKYYNNWNKDLHPFKIGFDWTLNYYMKTHKFKYLTIEYPHTQHVGEQGTHCTKEYNDSEFGHIKLLNDEFDYNKIYLHKENS